jgi:hypothetical protein
VLVGLGCATVGAWWRGAPAPVVPHAAPAAVTRLSLEDRVELRRALAEDVRAAVAAALPAAATLARAEPGPAAAPAVEAHEAVLASAPPSAAHEAAHQAVADAITRGVWRTDDAQALRATIPELGPGEASQVLAELSRAINTGALQVAMHDRPIL